MARFSPVPISQACSITPACNLVSNGWNSMTDFGNDVYADTKYYLDALYGQIDPNDLEVPTAALAVQLPTPNLSSPLIGPAPTPTANLTPTIPSVPQAPTIPAVPSLNVPSAPQFLTAFPTVNLPAAPGALQATEPGAAPTFNAPPIPVSPNTTIPAAPTLRSLNIPNAPVVTIPTFGGTDPGLFNDTFTPNINYSESLYDSALLQEVQGVLLDSLQNGDGGLDPLTVDQMWERERERELMEYRRAVDTSQDEFASRGFGLPPGALSARLREVERENIGKTVTMGREKTIENIQRAYEHVKFVIQNTIGLEGQLMNYTNSLYQRLLTVQTSLLEAGVSSFNAKVQAYNAQVQAYGVYAQVFNTRVQAELTKIEVFRAQIEGQKAIGELNVQDLELYKTGIDAVQSVVEIYRVEMQAAQIEAETQRVGIDAFRAEVEAYKAKIDAKTAEYEGYAQQINGELAKTRIYETSANAYSSEVQGYRALVDAESTRVRADTDQNRALIEQYQGEIAAFKVQVDAESSRIGAEVNSFGAQVEAYRAEITGETAKTDAQVANLRAEVDVASTDAQLQLEVTRANIARAQAFLGLYSDTLKSGAEISAQLTASAMDAINLSAGISGSDITNN